MDFRSRHKSAPIWSEQEIIRQMSVEIYQNADSLGIFQLEAPDRSTNFLVCFATYYEDISLSQYYAIEAPYRCTLREAFEVGNMSWMDFWSHRGWLLRLDVPTKGGDVPSVYITPDDFDDLTLKLFKHYGNRGPLLLMRKQLETRIKIAEFKGEDTMEDEREYLEFMARHGHRLSTRAA